MEEIKCAKGQSIGFSFLPFHHLCWEAWHRPGTLHTCGRGWRAPAALWDTASGERLRCARLCYCRDGRSRGWGSVCSRTSCGKIGQPKASKKGRWQQRGRQFYNKNKTGLSDSSSGGNLDDLPGRQEDFHCWLRDTNEPTRGSWWGRQEVTRANEGISMARNSLEHKSGTGRDGGGRRCCYRTTPVKADAGGERRVIAPADIAAELFR